jgi:hypothetical protein
MAAAAMLSLLGEVKCFMGVWRSAASEVVTQVVTQLAAFSCTQAWPAVLTQLVAAQAEKPWQRFVQLPHSLCNSFCKRPTLEKF